VVVTSAAATCCLISSSSFGRTATAGLGRDTLISFAIVAHRLLHAQLLANHTLGGYIRRMRKDIKASCQKRLNRIEGQVRGLSKMVEEDRYCIDVITQISAVRAALRRVEEEVLKDHVSHCVDHAISTGNKADQRKKISELMAVIGRSQR
jgi:CsoR family transcriptional regulator, copper-sensing transcriptional repressor